MSTTLLWTDTARGQRIRRDERPSDETLDLLSNTIWGSHASRYRILNLAGKLRRLRAPGFFVLSEGAHDLAVIVLDECTKSVRGRPCPAYHFVMAATRPDRRDEGLAGLLLDQVRAYCVETLGRPGFGFAYVEAATAFSLRLSDRIGFAVEAEIPLTLFTRLAPRQRQGIRTLRSDEVSWLRQELEAQYVGHELADFDASIRPSEYSVICDGNRILAGAQAEILRWRVVDMPGIAGWILLHVWPRLPGARALLDPSDLAILRLGNLFVPEGNERHLERLLVTLLAIHGARIGLIMLDSRSPVLNRLCNGLRRGLLSRALNGSAKLRIDGVGLSDDMVEALSARPLLVSAADVL